MCDCLFWQNINKMAIEMLLVQGELQSWDCVFVWSFVGVSSTLYFCFRFSCLCFGLRTFKYALTCTKKSLRDDILF